MVDFVAGVQMDGVEGAYDADGKGPGISYGKEIFE